MLNPSLLNFNISHTLFHFCSFLLQVYVCDFQKKKKNHDTWMMVSNALWYRLTIWVFWVALFFHFFFYLRWRSWTSRDWPLLSTYPPAAPRVSCTESCTRSTWRSASSGGSKSGGSSVGKKMNLLLETNFHWLYMKYLAFFLRCVFFACLCSAFFFWGGGVLFLFGGALTLIFVSGHGEKLSM